MRKSRITISFAAFIAFAALCASPVFSFDVSPTQSKAVVSKKKQVVSSKKLLSEIVSDDSLRSNIEMLVLTDGGERLSSLRGNLSEPFSGNMETAARDYVLNNSKLFNLPASTLNSGNDFLKTVRNEQINGVSHISFAWNIDGVNVYNALIEIHIGKNGVVQLANGSFPTIKEVANSVSISSTEALEAAKSAASLKTLRGKARSELTLFCESEKARWAYVVKIPASDPLGDWEILIDAETRHEISRLNQMRFAFREGLEAEGVGSVYVNHPSAGPVENVKLYHLTSNTLKGEYANVVNEDTPSGISETHEHIYDPNDTHFDEANVYFYISNIHDYFWSLGFRRMEFPMTAIVHYGTNYDNAGFSMWEEALIFGDGAVKFFDLAKEETVTYHEYGHAHLAEIVSLNYSAESGAMDEGQADYFACSLSNDPKLGEYVCGKSGKPWLRNLTDKLHYPEDIKNEVHQDGKIWGATLWDLRISLGAKITDQLVENSLYYLKNGGPTFIDGYNSIMEADRETFGGAHSDTITKIFNNRGILKAHAEEVFTPSDLKTMATFNLLYK
ncbi:MAG: M36 family metallopeptidase [Candidatus Riflebacteria bacterium]|nr:M36 family metallopeptidase [Candidatus Riflebacteria bacterium]